MQTLNLPSPRIKLPLTYLQVHDSSFYIVRSQSVISSQYLPDLPVLMESPSLGKSEIVENIGSSDCLTFLNKDMVETMTL